MPDGSDDHSKPFFLTRGGPFYRLERRLGLVREDGSGIAIRIAVAIGVTFLPLVGLAALQGVLLGPGVALPLLRDVTTYARFVLAVPLLLYAEGMIERRLTEAIAHFRTSGILTDRARADFDSALGRLERARDAVLPEVVIVLAVLSLGWVNSRVGLGPPVASWIAIEPGAVTWAGRWLALVSMPAFQFLVLRWLWRIGLWTRFLVRMARADLNLIPTHPDGAAGLAFLGGVHTTFGWFLVPLATSVAARGVQWVQFGDGTLDSLRNALIVFAVIALAVAIGPLQVFMPRLLATKRRGQFDYATLAAEYTQGFDRKWLRQARTEEPLVGSADIQSLADLANSFAIIRGMRVTPLSRWNVLSLVLAAVLPMLPIVLLVLPLEELVKQVLNLVLR